MFKYFSFINTKHQILYFCLDKNTMNEKYTLVESFLDIFLWTNKIIIICNLNTCMLYNTFKLDVIYILIAVTCI